MTLNKVLSNKDDLSNLKTFERDIYQRFCKFNYFDEMSKIKDEIVYETPEQARNSQSKKKLDFSKEDLEILKEPRGYFK